jgi:hypothetical protein
MVELLEKLLEALQGKDGIILGFGLLVLIGMVLSCIVYLVDMPFGVLRARAEAKVQRDRAAIDAVREAYEGGRVPRSKIEDLIETPAPSGETGPS